MRPCVPQRQIAERIAHRLEQRLGKTDRERDAERVTKARCVFDGDETGFAGDADRQHPPGIDERGDARGNVSGQRPITQLGLCQISDRQQHVVHGVRTLDAVARINPLKLPFDGIHRLGVQEFAQFGVAQQLAELRLIDRQRLRSPS